MFKLKFGYYLLVNPLIIDFEQKPGKGYFGETVSLRLFDYAGMQLKHCDDGKVRQLIPTSVESVPISCYRCVAQHEQERFCDSIYSEEKGLAKLLGHAYHVHGR